MLGDSHTSRFVGYGFTQFNLRFSHALACPQQVAVMFSDRYIPNPGYTHTQDAQPKQTFSHAQAHSTVKLGEPATDWRGFMEFSE